MGLAVALPPGVAQHGPRSRLVGSSEAVISTSAVIERERLAAEVNRLTLALAANKQKHREISAALNAAERQLKAINAAIAAARRET